MKKEHLKGHEIKQEGPLEKVDAKDAISALKEGLGIQKINPILAYVEKFDEYFKKKKKILESGVSLFTPGIDNHFYIITSGGLDIFRQTLDGKKKEIGKARAGSFIGEGVIFGRFQKDVEAITHSKTEIFALTKEDLQKLEKECPEEAMELYKYIIEVTNKRLLDSGKELAELYETTNKIIELSKSGEKGFTDIMQYLKALMMVDYIMFVENHPAIDGFFFYKYSTELQSLGNLNRKCGEEVNKDLCGIYAGTTPLFGSGPNDSVYVMPLKNGDKLKGYLFAGKKKGLITDNEMRISSNISPLLASIVENNQKESEKKAMEMSKNYFDKGIRYI